VREGVEDPKDQQEGPKDPTTPLSDVANNLHEMFRAMIDAGFSEKQACLILGNWLAGQGG